MRWHDHSRLVADGRAARITLFDGGANLSYRHAIRLWQADEEFRSYFIDLLSDAPFDAYRFETPPVALGNSDRPFEFVLVDSPSLERRASRRAFQDRFAAADFDDLVLTFANLSGDAMMVVPCPLDDDEAYGHVAAFARRAPADQQDALWQSVGAAMAQRLSDRPVWLSTAGGGVPWLHVRLDDRPKYYAYRRYRDWQS